MATKKRKRKVLIQSTRRNSFPSVFFLILVISMSVFFISSPLEDTTGQFFFKLSKTSPLTSQTRFECQCPDGPGASDSGCLSNTARACSDRECRRTVILGNGERRTTTYNCALQRIETCGCPNIDIKAVWDRGRNRYSVEGRRCTLQSNTCPKEAKVCSDNKGCTYTCQQIDTWGGVIGEPYPYEGTCTAK